MTNTHGGKRKNCGRKKLNKFKKTFSLDEELRKFKIPSKLVNELLREEYKQELETRLNK